MLQLLSNYLWSWDDRVGGLLEELPDSSGNPHQAVRELSDEHLQKLAAAGFGPRLEQARAHQQAYLAGAPRKRTVAYFSAEFGLHECLPIYSGGLGVLAGDHIKAASDLGLPLVAVGLIYRYGYFRQHIDIRGQQHEEYPEFRPEERGLRQVALADGRPLEISLRLDGRHLNVQVWQADVGRVPLYLLDTNLDSNQEIDRWITSHLYGGDRDTRIKQEIVLGVAGFRALRALGWDSIETFHLNEGHAALLCLEAMREFVEGGASLGWAQARAAERIVFTTHTPVPAGHDTFAPELVAQYLGHYAAEELHCELPALLELGGASLGGEHFSMTELALNVSRAANGVSRQHGAVTRALFRTRPIDHVTNGVHHLTWTSQPMKQLFDAHLPGWREEPGCLAQAPLLLPDDLLELAHQRNKHNLIDRVNALPGQLSFSAEHFTIGFARRFAAYKRAGLLFSDLERLRRLGAQGVQLVIAGKAHPRDEEGKRLLQEVVRLCAGGWLRAAFMEDYDLAMGRLLTAGADVWLNTPRRPLEASGTSGMKASLNGVPHLSVLDGWWAEAYDGRNGWAIGMDEGERAVMLSETEAEAQDARDAEALYGLLEETVLPEYFGQRAAWLRRMKCAIATGARFTSQRMAAEYARRAYRL